MKNGARVFISVQSANVVSLRDELINLGPGVKRRGDKIKTLGPRGDKRNACGAMDPGLRRDDGGRGAGPRKNECFCGVLVDHGIQVNRCPVRQHRQQRFVSLRDELINLGPAIKSRGDKIKTLGPRGDKRNACGAMDPGLRRDDDREAPG